MLRDHLTISAHALRQDRPESGGRPPCAIVLEQAEPSGAVALARFEPSPAMVEAASDTTPGKPRPRRRTTGR